MQAAALETIRALLVRAREGREPDLAEALVSEGWVQVRGCRLPATELAALLGRTQQDVQRWQRKGAPSEKEGGRRVWPVAQVVTWLEESAREGMLPAESVTADWKRLGNALAKVAAQHGPEVLADVARVVTDWSTNPGGSPQGGAPAGKAQAPTGDPDGPSTAPKDGYAPPEGDLPEGERQAQEGDWPAFAAAWWDRYGVAPVPVGNLAKLASGLGLFGLVGKSPPAQAASLGKKLSKLAGNDLAPGWSLGEKERDQSNRVCYRLADKEGDIEDA